MAGSEGAGQAGEKTTEERLKAVERTLATLAGSIEYLARAMNEVEGRVFPDRSESYAFSQALASATKDLYPIVMLYGSIGEAT